MSIDSIRPTAAAEAPTTEDSSPDPSTPKTPTITYYQFLADNFSKALDEIVKAIPDLEAPHPATVSFVRTHLNIPIPFLATAITAVEKAPELQGVKKLDVVNARDALQFVEAFRSVVDQVAFFAKNLQFTMDSRLALLGVDALQIYQIAKGVARDPGSGHVAELVANMKRDLGRRGPTKGSAKARKPAPDTTAQQEGKDA